MALPPLRSLAVVALASVWSWSWSCRAQNVSTYDFLSVRKSADGIACTRTDCRQRPDIIAPQLQIASINTNLVYNGYIFTTPACPVSTNFTPAMYIYNNQGVGLSGGSETPDIDVCYRVLCGAGKSSTVRTSRSSISLSATIKLHRISVSLLSRATRALESLDTLSSSTATTTRCRH